MRTLNPWHQRIKHIWIEFFLFFKANFYSAIYGILFVIIIFISSKIHFTNISRFDGIFISILMLQWVLILFKIETKRDFLIIMIFHIIATIMEVFKTSENIGSWQYPGVSESILKIYNVPLFTGFMYSAVWSYISRAQEYLQLHYKNYPKNTYVLALCIWIYLNFFSHHYIPDLRYILLLITVFLFWKTQVLYKVYKKERRMHFITTALLTAFFIWGAENISTFYQIWLYPDQVESWKMVSLSKITSWFLLLIVSFWVISTLKKFKLN